MSRHSQGMTQYRRPHVPGATIFFSVNLQNPGSDLLIREINLLRFSVARTLRWHPVEVQAWTVLPDHMHCIWTLPAGDSDYATRWRQIKTYFSRALPPSSVRQSMAQRQERGIWQRRFWEHHIRNPQELRELRDYCWRDPVKHGLVKRPEDWAYSSFTKRTSVPA